MYVFGRTYDAATIEYRNTNSIPWGSYTYRYAKVAGSTLLSSSASQSWSTSTNSIRVFYVEYRIYVWIGYLSFHIEGNVNFRASLQIEKKSRSASIEASCGPVFSVTGGAVYTMLVKYTAIFDLETDSVTLLFLC